MKNLLLLSVLGLGLLAAPAAQAQPASVAVRIGVGPVVVGAPPVCAYGYFPDYPYACAPYGYYGPEWFSGGVFIGAGPWFHGFHGRTVVVPRRGPDARSGFRGGAVVRGPAPIDRRPAGNGFRGSSPHGGAPRGGSHGGRRR